MATLLDEPVEREDIPAAGRVRRRTGGRLGLEGGRGLRLGCRLERRHGRKGLLRLGGKWGRRGGGWLGRLGRLPCADGQLGRAAHELELALRDAREACLDGALARLQV